MYPVNFSFRMPPEWSKHSCTFMEWPIKEADWPEPFEEVLKAFSEVVKKIAMFEPVMLITRPDLVKQATEMCGSSVRIIEMMHDDSWMRDNGPTFIVNDKGEIAGINWIFNAWGGKFPCELDNQVTPKLLKHLDIRRFDAHFIMEGGSIHVDGEGTLLSTEECLLNKNRNPHFSKKDIEELLKKYLGIEKIIWLKKGLYGDDTDGHVDNVACFASPGVILMQTCSNPKDPNYEVSRENIRTLENEVDARGRKLKIIQIEQPPEAQHNDVRLTLSYLNFYFVNGGIILPVFGGDAEKTDKEAEAKLAQVFPERKIVPVYSKPITWGGGNIHCATQQMPEVIRP